MHTLQKMQESHAIDVVAMFETLHNLLELPLIPLLLGNLIQPPPTGHAEGNAVEVGHNV